jgi:hypothetical protein
MLLPFLQHKATASEMMDNKKQTRKFGVKDE